MLSSILKQPIDSDWLSFGLVPISARNWILAFSRLPSDKNMELRSNPAYLEKVELFHVLLQKINRSRPAMAAPLSPSRLKTNRGFE